MKDCAHAVKRIYGEVGYDAYATCLDGDIGVDAEGRVTVDGAKVYLHNPL